jgi:hypothetical protein
VATQDDHLRTLSNERGNGPESFTFPSLVDVVYRYQIAANSMHYLCLIQIMQKLIVGEIINY